MTIRPSEPPYYGAAYYPEDWPLEQIDQDIALMKKAGMNVMRVGEFAWSSMEPEEGRYDFGWLHLVVEKLAAAGISTIMCTPTCTPPIWLTEKHPEILFVNTHGARSTHGGRRHACPNNPVYRDYCKAIVTHMAEEFGDDDRIIGWQIDNEVYPQDRSCCCPVCIKKFHKFLRERYETIENLNKAWCNSLWSQTYLSFDQIPVPANSTWHHPSLLMAWDDFNSKSYVDYVTHQANILHQFTKHPIGTDMMPTFGVDHYDMTRKLDVVQFNHYHYRENFWESCFWFDYMRPLKQKPFWNTETSTSWSGSTTTTGYSEPGFCRVNSWLPIAMGGQAILFWLWRQHWAGQELMHGAVLQSCGRPMHIFDEVKEVSKGFTASADFINGTKPINSGFAMHLSNPAHITFRNQRIVNGLEYTFMIMRNIYHPLICAQFRPDFIDPAMELDDYKLIFSPLLPALDQAGLRERIKTWIESGGTWVVGPLSDIRTMDGAKFTNSPYSILEELGGVYCRYQLPGEPRDFEIEWTDGPASKGSLWYDILEPRGAKILARYTEGPGEGLAAVTEHVVGKGRVILLGTLPIEEDMVRLIQSIGKESGVEPVAQASENLMVIPRTGDAGEGLIAVELENRSASLTLSKEASDLITGKKYSGQVDLPPYGVMVLKYN